MRQQVARVLRKSVPEEQNDQHMHCLCRVGISIANGLNSFGDFILSASKARECLGKSGGSYLIGVLQQRSAASSLNVEGDLKLCRGLWVKTSGCRFCSVISKITTDGVADIPEQMVF